MQLAAPVAAVVFMTAAAIAAATDRLDNASRDSEQGEHKRKEPRKDICVSNSGWIFMRLLPGSNSDGSAADRYDYCRLIT
jgi:hypothetical protein